MKRRYADAYLLFLFEILPSFRHLGSLYLLLLICCKLHCLNSKLQLFHCIGKSNRISLNNLFLCKFLKKIISTDKLYTYLELFNVQVVNKRLGYLLQQLDLFSDFRKNLLSTIRDGYTPLEPSLPKDGHHYSTWKIQDNIDVAAALTTLLTV